MDERLDIVGIGRQVAQDGMEWDEGWWGGMCACM